ncbi:DedA family protein [Herbaspirillum sp. HC18]|nr:DedA family protein [Herbaspirillum sp. HC18]
MDIAGFIQEYGYAAVALGSFLEGEAVLLAGSLAAAQGHLEPKMVLLIAALASFAGDLPYFFAGRRYGQGAMQRWPALRYRKARLQRLLHRHHVLLVLGLRFLYGMRVAGLLAIGMSRIGALRFLLLDFIGAIIWAAVICSAGFGAGRLLQSVIERAGSISGASMFLAAVACSSVLFFAARRRLAGNRSRRR